MQEKSRMNTDPKSMQLGRGMMGSRGSEDFTAVPEELQRYSLTSEFLKNKIEGNFTKNA